MFQTKAELRATIKRLELELETERHHTRRSAYIEKANLPPLKNVGCLGCKHAFRYTDTKGLYVLGCAKDVGCDSFEAADTPKVYTQANVAL